MPSSIRDPIQTILLLFVAIAQLGCGFVLGDIPDNPEPDARTIDASMPDEMTPPDVSWRQDAQAEPDVRQANDEGVADVIAAEAMSSDVVTSDVVRTDVMTGDSMASDSMTSDRVEDAPIDRPVDQASPDVKDASTDPGVLDPCDMDRDGYRSDGCAGGDDCDDTTAEVHPVRDAGDQVPFHDTPTHGAAGGGFDYNCNGRPDPEFTVALNCSGLSLATCPDNMIHSFLGMTTPACGQRGDFGHCSHDLLTCFSQTEEMGKIMRCR
jgi:hypothetical protein